MFHNILYILDLKKSAVNANSSCKMLETPKDLAIEELMLTVRDLEMISWIHIEVCFSYVMIKMQFDLTVNSSKRNNS